MAGFLDSQTSAQQTEAIYIAYFGRAADGGGYSYWTNQFADFEAAGNTVDQAATLISNSFAVQPEATAKYAFLAAPPTVFPTTDPVQVAAVDAFINQVYQNLFNRAANSGGLAYWQGQILGGQVPVGTAVYAIANGALGTDQGILTDKIVAGQTFTSETFAANLGATSPLAPSFVAAAQDAVVPVVDATTLAASQAATTAYVANPGTGQTLTLTTGVDHIVGTGNDTVIGTIANPSTSSTLNPGDSINGGSGSNTLSIVDTAGSGTNDLVGVTLANIQTVSVQNASPAGPATIDLTLYPSVSKVVALNTLGNHTDNFTGLAAGAQVVASGAASGAGVPPGPNTSFVNFAYAAPTDAVSVGVDGGANGVTISPGGAGATATAATISSTGTPGTVNGTKTAPDTFNLGGAATVATLTVDAAVNLVANLSAGAFKATGVALTVSGAAPSVNILGPALPFTTIDASGMTAGGLTIGTGALLTSLTGGAGNDVITVDAAPTGAATINLGKGNNELLGTTPFLPSATIDGGSGGLNTLSSGLINNGNAANFKDFQDLSLQSISGTTLDTALIAGITALSVDVASPGVGATYSNLAPSDTLTDTFVGSNSGATNTLQFKGLTGTSNAYTIAFNGAAQTAAPTTANLLLGTIDATGINNVTITSGGGANTWNSLRLGTDTAANTVTIKGSQNLDLFFGGFGSTTAPNTGVTSIDGSAATGNLAINLAGLVPAAAGITVKGATGHDTITTSTFASTLTGGGGADTFIIGSTPVGNGLSANPIFTTITDAIVTDKITFMTNPLDTGFISKAIDESAATNLGSALNIATVAAGADKEDWFQFGGNTYVLQHIGPAAPTLGAGDVFAQLNGSVNLATATYSTSTHTLTLA